MSVFGDAVDATLSGWRKADGSALSVNWGQFTYSLSPWLRICPPRFPNKTGARRVDAGPQWRKDCGASAIEPQRLRGKRRGIR